MTRRDQAEQENRGAEAAKRHQDHDVGGTFSDEGWFHIEAFLHPASVNASSALASSARWLKIFIATCVLVFSLVQVSSGSHRRHDSNETVPG